MGINPGPHNLFVAKSNDMDGKKGGVRLSSRQYYNDCKFNWKRSETETCYPTKQTS
jgi:hypothetical protein